MMSSSPVHLRPAATADIDSIQALERGTDNAPHWSKTAYEAILASADSGLRYTEGIQRCLFVAEKDGEILGFAVGLLHPKFEPNDAASASRSLVPDRVAELESVVVSMNSLRAGIGRDLCCAVFEWCRTRGATEVILEVRATSSGAVALYTNLGFVRAGRRPRYYSEPDDDALILRLTLR